MKIIAFSGIIILFLTSCTKLDKKSSNSRQGRVGAISTGEEMDQLIEWQEIAVEQSRMGIPLLYASDIIHGYQTIFLHSKQQLIKALQQL